MPRRRRRERIPTPAWDRERGAIGQRIGGRSLQVYGAAGVVLLVLAAIALIGYAFLSDYLEDRGRPGSTALRVGDTKYSVEYYTKRLQTLVQQSGGPGGSLGTNAQVGFQVTSRQLTEEALVLQFAGEQGQTASEDEITAEIATQLDLPANDPTFQTRYQEELTRSGLKEDQYREMIRASVLRKKVLDKFTAEVPAVAEAVHYRQIVVATQAEADDLRSQIESGADFVQLAKDNSLDTQTKDSGGEVGWAPRGILEIVLDKSCADSVFALEVNKVATCPTKQNDVEIHYVIQVIEKQADRTLEESHKSALADNAFQDWLTEKRSTLKVEDSMDVQSGDPDKVSYAFERVYPQLLR